MIVWLSISFFFLFNKFGQKLECDEFGGEWGGISSDNGFNSGRGGEGRWSVLYFIINTIRNW